MQKTKTFDCAETILLGAEKVHEGTATISREPEFCYERSPELSQRHAVLKAEVVKVLNPLHLGEIIKETVDRADFKSCNPLRSLALTIA